jgi:hypothetical protein
MSSLYFLLTWFPTYLVQQRTHLPQGRGGDIAPCAATIGVMLGGTCPTGCPPRRLHLRRTQIPIVTGFGIEHRARELRSGTALALALLTFAFFAQGVSSNMVDHRGGRAPNDDGHDGRDHQLHRPHRRDRDADPHRLHLRETIRSSSSSLCSPFVGALVYGGDREDSPDRDLDLLTPRATHALIGIKNGGLSG